MTDKVSLTTNGLIMTNPLLTLFVLSIAVAAIADDAVPSLADRFAYDPSLAAYYEGNSARIEQLRSIANDETASTADRLRALDEMSTAFARVSVDLVSGLVDDSNTDVAAKSVSLLADLAVMSNHGMEHHSDSAAPVAEMHSRHIQAKQALRQALLDPRLEVRSPAASLLASLDDREGLERLASQNAAAVIPDDEAVNYLGLASPAVSARYLLPYLDEATEEVQARAIAYLGASPEYQDQIRRDYLLNPSAGSTQRIAAAEVLSRSDPEFANYAPALAFEGGLPAVVYDLALASAIDKARKGTDRATLKLLMDSASQYMESHGVDLDATRAAIMGYSAPEQ